MKISDFADFEQVKQYYHQNSLWRNRMPRHFFWGYYPVSPALHPGFSDLWRPPPALSPTPTLGFLSFVTYGTPCRTRVHSHSPKETEDFPRGGNHTKHMPPLTYLACLQPMCYNFRLEFIHINTGRAFTCRENFDNKYRTAAKLISNHKLSNNCSLKKYISEHKCSWKLLSQKIQGETVFFIKWALVT